MKNIPECPTFPSFLCAGEEITILPGQTEERLRRTKARELFREAWERYEASFPRLDVPPDPPFLEVEIEDENGEVYPRFSLGHSPDYGSPDYADYHVWEHWHHTSDAIKAKMAMLRQAYRLVLDEAELSLRNEVCRVTGLGPHLWEGPTDNIIR